MNRPSRGSLASSFAALLALAFFLAPAAQAEPTRFGDRTLEIPAPAGFEPMSRDLPPYVEMLQAYLPATNRLVEAFATPEDKAAMMAGEGRNLSRYFQVQVMRSMEGQRVPEGEFGVAIEQAEAQIAALMPTIDAEAAKLSAKGNEALRDRTGTDASVSIGGVRNLGVFRREPWGLFFTTSGAVDVSEGGQSQTQRIVSANALVLVDGQVVYLYGYANEAEADARSWAESSVSTWADAVRAANGGSAIAADTPASDAASTADGSPSSGGISTTLVIVLLLGLLVVGVVLGLVLRRRR